MKKAMVVLGFLGSLGLAGARAGEAYEVDPAHSFILWKVQHAGAGFTWGRFTDFSGSLSLDATAPGKSSVSITVKASSVLTDQEKRDQHLKSPDFFNARQFPLITFQSSEVRPTGPESAEIRGELTLKGVKRAVTAQARRVGQQGELIGFEATFSIKRSDFGMAFGVGQGLGDEVQLIVAVEAKRK